MGTSTRTGTDPTALKALRITSRNAAVSVYRFTVLAPRHVTAALVDIVITLFPPLETTPTTAPAPSSAGPPLSPSQIDSPTANSLGATS
jgi:hypothetical protein